jgi:imidazolonepropionase-like amidohydrolase
MGIRVEGARIVELGPQIKSGVDVGGDWIVPGFIDSCSHLGLFEVGAEASSRDDADTGAITPDARAWDGFNPLSAPVPVARVEGITHTILCPRLDRLVSGQAALVRTAGRTVEEAVLRRPVALCVSMGRGGLSGEGAPNSRIGVGRALRAWIDGAPEPRQLSKRGTPEVSSEAASLSPADRVAQSVRERRIKVMVSVERADDIERALGWLDDAGLDGVLVGCAEGWLVADLLAEAAVPVVLGPLMVQPSSFDHPGARYDNAAILHDRGVPLAFSSRGNHHARGLRVDAGVLVAHGLPWEAAIQALTVGGAEAFSIPGLGRMEEGGRASFFRSTGDPLQPRTQIKDVWIGGRRTSMKTRQSELYERFKTLR